MRPVFLYPDSKPKDSALVGFSFFGVKKSRMRGEKSHSSIPRTSSILHHQLIKKNSKHEENDSALFPVLTHGIFFAGANG